MLEAAANLPLPPSPPPTILTTINMAKFDPPQKFSFMASEWPDWINEFKRFRTATKLNKEEGEVQRDSFLYAMGVKEAEKIMKTFTFQDGEDTDFTVLEKKFTDHFVPRVNIRHERAIFCARSQQTGETVEHFVRDLHALVSTCNYADSDDQILDRIVQGVSDPQVRRKLQLTDGLTLHKAVEIAQQYELIKTQEKERSGNVEEAISSRGRGKYHKRGRSRGRGRFQNFDSKKSSSSNHKCSRCNGDHQQSDRCPATGQTCNYCKKKGHFRAACLKLKGKKNASEVTTGEPEKDDDVVGNFWFESDMIEIIKENNTAWYHTLKVNDRDVKFKLDSGSDLTLITEECYKKFAPKPRLEPVKCKLNSPGGRVQVIGQFIARSEHQDKPCRFRVVVAKVRNNLLSREVSEALGLLQRNQDEVDEENDKAGLMKTEPTIIQLKANATPYKVCTPRRVAFPIMSKVEEELKRLEKEKIITKLTAETTDWCAPMCPVIKPNGKVRITVDYKKLNQNVKRPNLMLCNLEDIAPDLAGAKLFSTLDLASGFYQLPLAPESALLTTFITPFGRYHFNRVPMGINIGPEEFQRKINETLHGLEGVKAIMDDILVYGKTQKEHDERLKAVLDRIRESGLKLNKDKCFLRETEVKYFGHIVSEHGIKPSPDKIEAIKNMPAPQNVSDLRTLMGMLNYHAKFVSHLATIIKPLSDLLKQDVAWYWDTPQKNAFERAKDALTKAPALRYYRSGYRTVVSADASSYGLGAVLMQEQNHQLYPIAYASRTLTSAERNYAQIEKEGLASVWACEKFSKYLVGLDTFELWTDHKPLVPLMTSKDLDLAPIRMQKILLRMMRFNAQVKHVPGKQLVIADALSRSPIPHDDEATKQTEETEMYVDAVQSHWQVSMGRQAKLKTATSEDATLQQLTHFILHGWPKQMPQHLDAFKKVQGELSIVDGLVTFRNRIVIPESQRENVLQTLHESHQGYDKCLENARRTVWWPTLTVELKNLTSACQYCLERKPSQRYEPMKSTSLPSRPWEMLGTDLCTIKGHQFLIIIDYYSRWLEIKPLKQTTSKAVIQKMKEVFSIHGIPDIMISDNGPQFASQEFADFSSQYGFLLSTSSPYFPHGNAEAERAVQTAKKIIVQEKADIALLNYRATPHSATLVSPAEALMGRKLKTKLPTLEKNLVPDEEKDKLIRAADQKAKQSYKASFDKRHGVKKLSMLDPGDQILMRDENKWKPGNIIEMADGSGRSYHVDTDQGVYRRNRKDLQSVPPQSPPREDPQVSSYPPKTSSPPKTPAPKTTMPVTPRRSTRTRVPPIKYKDYVKP